MGLRDTPVYGDDQESEPEDGRSHIEAISVLLRQHNNFDVSIIHLLEGGGCKFEVTSKKDKSHFAVFYFPPRSSHVHPTVADNLSVTVSTPFYEELKNALEATGKYCLGEMVHDVTGAEQTYKIDVQAT